MRTINADVIENTVAELFLQANSRLTDDVTKAINDCASTETELLPSYCFDIIKKNIDAAKKTGLPLCQDTGMAVVFLEIGEEVFVSGNIKNSVNKGVKRAYKDGLMRLSVVNDPLFDRINTEDNTPAVIHTDFVPGNQIKITCAPKGFGSENKSRLKMFDPSAKPEDIIGFVSETVNLAGGSPCPPLVIGVGLGSDFEGCALLSKKALLRSVGFYNENPAYAALEKNILSAANKTGVGPQGFGGKTTALWAAVEYAPTHIAGLPCAVNICCHISRHASRII